MIRLQHDQLQGKLDFIQHYMTAHNAADGSQMDANANVTQKNIATLENELMKDFFVQINREKVSQKIGELFGEALAQEYVRQIEAHEIYVHDETSLKPYCVSLTLYPFLRDGLRKLGGESQAPQHLASFCGSFINLVFAVSAQFAGAVATVEFLTYFDHFARRDYGRDYLTTHTKLIADFMQQVVYSINQPAAARGYQSVFWNISLYDRYYFEAMFGDFVFPDFDRPDWESVSALQRFFLRWFNQERNRAVLTFPVVTAAMLSENGTCKDKDFADLLSQELASGNAFFIYISDNPDSLASCCRLRNQIEDRTFSYTLGAGGVATGSINVITLNMNRLVQDKRDLLQEAEKIHQYQYAYRKLMESYQAAGMLPVYDAGFISMDKQFLTIGINGMAEAAESQGIRVGYSPEYVNFVRERLKLIYDANQKAARHYGVKFNTEFVPAENLGVKNAQWDKADGYSVARDCYNSYFYVVEDESVNPLDKFLLHGHELIDYLDGGSALHLNLDEALPASGYRHLLDIAARTGCNYFCVNVRITICNACGHIDKRTLHCCSACASADIDYGTRVIGYLKRVSAFSSGRRQEHALRHYYRETATAVHH
ncbi:MAG: anaerobic ribonucleoside-triphosphate reductase [Cardiobacteriaceae bacterium]|nr:anaerobic ribonucleoside-triphosphate reductase [Cardiobacteriaceae bacterium]